LSKVSNAHLKQYLNFIFKSQSNVLAQDIYPLQALGSNFKLSNLNCVDMKLHLFLGAMLSSGY